MFDWDTAGGSCDPHWYFSDDMSPEDMCSQASGISENVDFDPAVACEILPGCEWSWEWYHCGGSSELSYDDLAAQCAAVLSPGYSAGGCDYRLNFAMSDNATNPSVQQIAANPTLAASVPGRFLCDWDWNGGIVPSEQRAADALSFPMENPTTSFDLADASYTCPDYVCVSEEGQAECDADPACSGLPW